MSEKPPEPELVEEPKWLLDYKIGFWGLGVVFLMLGVIAPLGSNPGDPTGMCVLLRTSAASFWAGVLRTFLMTRRFPSRLGPGQLPATVVAAIAAGGGPSLAAMLFLDECRLGPVPVFLINAMHIVGLLALWSAVWREARKAAAQATAESR